MKKVAGLILGLIPVSVYAECVPVPDCASIGYTETSCDGDSLKCPFDTSKLKCIPCDSSFRFACTGENIAAGIGSTCNGKYVDCECIKGGVFNNGECSCSSSCSVGNIYYSDGSCSSCVLADKTAIGIIVKDNEIVMSQRRNTGISWASTSTDLSALTNATSSSTAINDYAGKANTLAISEAYPDDTTNNNAAVYCNSYSTVGTSAGDWYLPAAGEIHEYFYGDGTNYNKINLTVINLGWNSFNTYYWSSTEHSYNGARAVSSSWDDIPWRFKSDSYSVSCLLAL